MSRRSLLRRLGAELFVHQLTPFVLCDYFLSTEVEDKNYRYLNNQAKRLRPEGPIFFKRPAILYVGLQDLETFSEAFLPRIRGNFVLITGAIHLTRRAPEEVIESVSAHSGLIAWFSQASELLAGVPDPFPLGLPITGLDKVLILQMLPPLFQKTRAHVPHCAVHDHYPTRAREVRQALLPVMSASKDYAKYLLELKSYSHTISPPGDRVDAHRHWEALAMYSWPVSVEDEELRALFQSSMFFSNDLHLFRPVKSSKHLSKIDRRRLFKKYWERQIRQILNAATLGDS